MQKPFWNNGLRLLPRFILTLIATYGILNLIPGGLIHASAEVVTLKVKGEPASMELTGLKGLEFASKGQIVHFAWKEVLAGASREIHVPDSGAFPFRLRLVQSAGSVSENGFKYFTWGTEDKKRSIPVTKETQKLHELDVELEFDRIGNPIWKVAPTYR